MDQNPAKIPVFGACRVGPAAGEAEALGGDWEDGYLTQSLNSGKKRSGFHPDGTGHFCQQSFWLERELCLCYS